MIEIKVNKELNYIHLLSGGLDSTYALMVLIKDIKERKKPRSIITPVFIDYGHYAAKAEFACVKKVAAKIITEFDAKSILKEPLYISLRSELFQWCKSEAMIGRDIGKGTCEIQNRNMVLVSILASYLFASAENQKIEKTVFEIHSGFKDGEMPDCNLLFFELLKCLLLVYKPNYKMNFIILQNISRQQIFKKMKRLLKGNESKLQQFKDMIISCYSPKEDGSACGKCWKCRNIKKHKNR
jgi:7-cyano-7-deazaguanine synthase in queuosine biosynthesis